MNTYSIGQGDANLQMDILCSDANGPVELGAAASLQMFISALDGRHPDVTLSAAAVADYAFTNGNFVNPGTSGKNFIARATWTEPETAVPGNYFGRVVASWNDGTVRSFPDTQAYFTVAITQKPA